MSTITDNQNINNINNISNRFSELQKLNKNGNKSLINICKRYNYNYNKNSNKIQLIHNILKNEFTPSVYNNFINYSDFDESIIKDRIIYLKNLTTTALKNLLKNYNLPQNGDKYLLVDRIVKYEYYNKIVLLKDQYYLINYKNINNLLYIPEINFKNNNYEYYNIDFIYYPNEFYNIDEYIKHLENLKHLNKYLLINEHLQNLSQDWLRLIQFILIENGWIFDSINYDEIISEAVDKKYVENIDNKSIIDKINTFNCDNNKCENCTICMDTINNNEQCKKLICGHIFHSNCIDTWLNRVLECPVCRKTIT